MEMKMPNTFRALGDAFNAGLEPPITTIFSQCFAVNPAAGTVIGYFDHLIAKFTPSKYRPAKSLPLKFATQLLFHHLYHILLAF